MLTLIKRAPSYHRRSIRNKKPISFLEIISISISIIALIISGLSYFSQNRQFQALYEENIKISIISRGIDGKTHYVKGPAALAPAFFSVEYAISIINNSSLPSIITDYEIDTFTENNIINYGTLFREQIVDEPLPITIDGNSNIIFTIIIYYPLTGEAYNVISKIYKYDSTPSLRRFIENLYENGVDIFNNTVSYTTIEDSYIVQQPIDMRQIIKRLRLTTAKGSIFDYIIKFYSDLS